MDPRVREDDIVVREMLVCWVCHLATGSNALSTHFHRHPEPHQRPSAD